MSVAMRPSWWSRTKFTDKRDQAQPVPRSPSSPSGPPPSVPSKLNVFASAFNGLSVRRQKTARRAERDPIPRSSPLQYSPPTLDTKVASDYDPFAHRGPTSIPLSSPTSNAHRLQKPPLPRHRANTDHKLRPPSSPAISPTTTSTTVNDNYISPSNSLRSPSLSSTAFEHTSPIIPCNPDAQHGGKSFATESHHDYDLSSRRLPLPKTPPARRLPPTPLSFNHDVQMNPEVAMISNGKDFSNLDPDVPALTFVSSHSTSTPKRNSPSEEVTGTALSHRTPSLSPQNSVSVSPAPTLRNGNLSAGRRDIHPELDSSLLPPYDKPSKPTSVKSASTAKSKRERVTSDASLFSTESQEGVKAPKKQHSFHNLKSAGSFLPTLRHANSFTPSTPTADGNGASSNQSIAPRPITSPHSPQKTHSQKGRRRLFSAGGSKMPDSSDLSEKNSRAFKVIGGSEDDGLSTFSLPSVLTLPSSRELPIPIHMDRAPPLTKDQFTPTPVEVDRHIVPPEKLMELMNAPSPEPIVQRQVVGAETARLPGTAAIRSQDPSSSTRPARSMSLQATSNAGMTGLQTLRPAASFISDTQGYPVLRPRPRKPIGTVSKRRGSFNRSTTPQSSISPHHLDHTSTTSTTSLRGSEHNSPQSRLTRTASFLTLDDDDEIQFPQRAGAPKSMVDWDSDTPEETSFFDFSRGVNSMDSNDPYFDD